MRQIHESGRWTVAWALGTIFALLAGQLLLAGCSSLCGKRLYLFRDTPEKSVPTSGLALLITDPNLAGALMPKAKGYLEAAGQWAAEQPAHQSDVYRLSIEDLDGKPVFQGLCLDTTPTDACEVRPGPRQVRVRLDMFGPWGHQSVKEVARLYLEAGGCYFLRPDWEALRNKSLILKVERLPDAYTAEVRARLMDWERKNSKGRNIAD